MFSALASFLERETMLDLTGVHDTRNCNLGADGPCDACSWAQDVQEQRDYFEWSLFAEMNGFAARFGPDALRQQVGQYMAARRLF